VSVIVQLLHNVTYVGVANRSPGTPGKGASKELNNKKYILLKRC